MVPSEPVVSMSGSTMWFRLGDPQPRAWLVNRTVLSENPAADITKISLASEALVDNNAATLDSANQPSDLTTAPERAESNPSGTVTITSDRPGKISLSANCPTKQFLVVGESYHPGWQATVDHQIAPISRANGDFIGLPVAPGEHEITLEFKPESLRYGRFTSAFGLSLMAALLVFTAWPARRQRS